MLDKFLSFITEQILLPKESRVLLAVSGGADSIAMAHLFNRSPYSFGIAHCNFQLRAVDSDGDELFVKKLALRMGVPFYSKAFDTKTIASRRNISIQMAARELRYEWLEEIRQSEGWTHIATAHHLNDSIETLVYNLAKGCGIRGLHGIPVTNGHLIRPLLFARREEIEAYCTAAELAFREDSSNAEDHYGRNHIRLNVLPALKKINPSLEATMAENIARFREVEYLYDWAIRQLAQEVVIGLHPHYRLSIEELLQHREAMPSILFELLTPFGFHSRQIPQIIASIDRVGSVFHSPAYRLLVDRHELLVESNENKPQPEEFLIHPEAAIQHLPVGTLHWSYHEGRPASFSASERIAELDADKLKFPLRLRRWREGDVFQPLGMKGKHQKVQDFFSNVKVSRFEKERSWILEDADGQICWLMGYRIDERFRILTSSRAYWVFEFKKV